MGVCTYKQLLGGLFNVHSSGVWAETVPSERRALLAHSSRTKDLPRRRIALLRRLGGRRESRPVCSKQILTGVRPYPQQVWLCTVGCDK
eukprot:6306847-Amphidinium_carterae.2